jgi:hypothetical protein
MDKDVSCVLAQLTTAYGKQRRISAVTDGHYPWLSSGLRWIHSSKDRPHLDMVRLLDEPKVHVECLARLCCIKNVKDSGLDLETDNKSEVSCEFFNPSM